MWERRPWQPQQGLAEETRTEHEVPRGWRIGQPLFVGRHCFPSCQARAVMAVELIGHMIALKSKLARTSRYS